MIRMSTNVILWGIMAALCPPYSARGAGPTSISWIDQFGGTGTDAALGVDVNHYGEAIVVGSQDMRPTSNGSASQAFAKLYDSRGRALWSISFGDNGQFSSALTTAFDEVGNILVGGRVGRRINGIYSTSTQDIFLAKYDSSGNKLWSFVDTFGTMGIFSSIQSLDTAPDGSIYAAGYRGGSGFVSRWTPNGQLAWLRQLPRSTFVSESLTSIKYFDNGTIYVSGWSRRDFDDEHSIVARFDASGNQIWNKQLSLDTATTAVDLATDADGNVYVVGITGESVLPPENDSFIAQLDANGQLVWSNRFGRPGYDLAYAVDTLSDGRALLAGISGGVFSGDKTTAALYLGVANQNGEIEELRPLGPNVSSFPFGIATGDESGAAWLVGRTFGGLGTENLGLADAFVMKLVVPEPSGLTTCIFAVPILLSRRRVLLVYYPRNGSHSNSRRARAAWLKRTFVIRCNCKP